MDLGNSGSPLLPNCALAGRPGSSLKAPGAWSWLCLAQSSVQTSPLGPADCKQLSTDVQVLPQHAGFTSVNAGEGAGPALVSEEWALERGSGTVTGLLWTGDMKRGCTGETDVEPALTGNV